MHVLTLTHTPTYLLLGGIDSWPGQLQLLDVQVPLGQRLGGGSWRRDVAMTQVGVSINAAGLLDGCWAAGQASSEARQDVRGIY